MNKKQLILLFIGSIGFIVLFVVVLALQQAPSSGKASDTATKTGDKQSSDNTAPMQYTAPSSHDSTSPVPSRAPVATQTPPLLSADETAQAFYFSLLRNPGALANGNYQTNSYLSSDFKSVIHDLYDKGNIPVFCPQNKRASIVVGQDQQVYYDEGYLTQVVISEAPPGNRQLYRVLLQNSGGRWYIFDVNCIY